MFAPIRLVSRAARPLAPALRVQVVLAASLSLLAFVSNGCMPSGAESGARSSPSEASPAVNAPAATAPLARLQGVLTGNPRLWVIVLDPTMPEARHDAISCHVAEALRLRFISTQDALALIAIGRTPEIVWEGPARLLEEARGVAERLAAHSDVTGSDIHGALVFACLVLREHPGPKRLVIVSDLTMDPAKDDPDGDGPQPPVTVATFADPLTFDWRQELTDPQQLRVRIFGVEPHTAKHLEPMLAQLRDLVPELRLWRPSYRISVDDIAWGIRE